MGLEEVTLESEMGKNANVLTGKWAERSKLLVDILHFPEEVIDLLFYSEQLVRWDGW